MAVILFHTLNQLLQQMKKLISLVVGQGDAAAHLKRNVLYLLAQLPPLGCDGDGYDPLVLFGALREM